jgi:hypothetical protein
MRIVPLRIDTYFQTAADLFKSGRYHRGARA